MDAAGFLAHERQKMPFRIPYTSFVVMARRSAILENFSFARLKSRVIARKKTPHEMLAVPEKKHRWSSATMARVRLDAVVAGTAGRVVNADPMKCTPQVT